MIQTVIASIPGLGDLPGLSSDIIVDGEFAADIRALLPGGKDWLYCILTPGHIGSMGATVRVVNQLEWEQAVRVCKTRCGMVTLQAQAGIPLDSDDIEVVIDKQEPEPPTLSDPSLPGAGDERTVYDLGQWQCYPEMIGVPDVPSDCYPEAHR